MSSLGVSTYKLTCLSILLLLFLYSDDVSGKRVSSGSPQHRRLHRRAIMMRLTDEPTDCQESSIAEKNVDNKVILTGTVSSCDGFRAGSYRCRIKVWRVMKGQDEIHDIISGEDTFAETFTSNSFIDVYGFGNKEYCKSLVTIHDTKIFFIKRINGKAVLGSSLMHITLKNLEDIQAVIEGREIEERPPKAQDPCLDVLCGYGAKCKIVDGLPTCACPPVSCGEAEEVGEVEVAPLCGSDGITYPNECRLKAAMCKKQRRVKILSYTYCSTSTYPTYSTKPRSATTMAPRPEPGKDNDGHEKDHELCATVHCSFGAKCDVSVNDLGEREAQCKCETCAGVPVAPVCGSDQQSHRSECEMIRKGCLQSKKITVLRRGPCDPCEMYNETLSTFVRSCSGMCTIDEHGSPRCCDDIICDNDEKSLVCGSDGRTYDSACSLEKQACRTARDIRIVANEKCGPQKPNTIVRGSFSIATNENCPANCDVDSEEFQDFAKSLQLKINKRLQDLSTDMKRMYDFEFEHRRENSITFFFRAKINTVDQPYGEDELPNERFLWAYQRLYDPNHGVVTKLAAEEKLDLIHTENSLNNFYIEDVCLHHQCDNGARCEVNKSDVGEYIPTCTCDAIADPDRLPYTFACKQQSDNEHMKYRTFSNKEHVRKSMCADETHQYYFVNICENQEPTANCDDIGGCKGEGEACIMTNGQPRCVCVTCNSKEYRPICASNGKTFRNKCELQQHNCEKGKNLKIVSTGSCENYCDGMMCAFWSECQLSVNGLRSCVCPTEECPDDEMMICGSDGNEYTNECMMRKYACANELDIIALEEGGCDYYPLSGSGDICDCEFGTCTPVDGGEYLCVCDLQCEDEPTEKMCGSDGKMYRNMCELKKQQCVIDEAIDIVNCEVDPTESDCDCYWQATISGQESKCDPDTKQCPCLLGIGGTRCDRCMPGFWDFRSVANHVNTGCQECMCNGFGSLREDCDQMDGSCSCKPGVIGRKCDVCARDGSKIDQWLCVPQPQEPETDECDLKCPPGKRCPANRDDDFDTDVRCECIPLSTCDELPVNVVCGSNGVTYSNECEMYAQTCPYGEDVKVISPGECQDHVTVKPGESTTTTTTTTITTPIKPFTQEPEDDGSGGSGDSTSDDEDEELNEKSMTNKSDKPAPITDQPTHDYMMLGECMFYWHNGIKMKYDYDLMKSDSNKRQKYDGIVKNKILELASSSAKLNGKIVDVLVKEYPPQIDHSMGVKVSFGLAIREPTDDMTRPDDVQDTLNAITGNSKEASDFKIWLPGGSNWVIPEFGGDSFIQFDQIDEVRSLNFTMLFKSYDNDGILFHLGKEGNFISVIIDKGKVALKYDAGRGKLSIDKSRRNVSDGLWHIFFARLNRRDVMYQVDNEKPHYGDAPPAPLGSYGLFPMNYVFIGGIDDSLKETVEKQSGVGKGLTGCINDFTLYKGQMPLNTNFKLALKTKKINQCGSSPCYPPNQCLNGANCLVTKQDSGGFTKTCLCNLCYEGEHCENRIDPCLSNPCPFDQTCRPEKNNTSFICLCLTEDGQEADCALPVSTLGRSSFMKLNPADLKSSEVLNIDTTFSTTSENVPTFGGGSFMKLNLSDLKNTEVLNIDTTFSTTNENGLIFYMGDGKPDGNMVVLLLESSVLRFISKVGNAQTKIPVGSGLSLDSWHNVRITLDEAGCMFNVDSSEFINQPLKLNFSMEFELSVGGVDWDESTLLINNITYLYDGLKGSIQKFSVNDEKLVTNMKRLINKKDTEVHKQNQCTEDLCKNGGVCHPHFNGSYCQCRVGYTGPTCMTDIDQTIIQLDGTTKGSYQRSQTSSPFPYEEVSLSFKNKSLNGTLLEIPLAHEGSREPDNGSFVSLRIVGDRVRASEEMMDYRSETTSKTAINLQSWNTVKFQMWPDVSLLYLNGGSPSVISHFNQIPFQLKFGTTLRVGGNSVNDDYFRGCFRRLTIGLEVVQLSHIERSDGKGKFSDCDQPQQLL